MLRQVGQFYSAVYRGQECEKALKPLETANSGPFDVLPEVGLEPTPCCQDGILNPLEDDTQTLTSKRLTLNQKNYLYRSSPHSLYESPELLSILEAWPELSADARREILSIVKKHSKQSQ